MNTETGAERSLDKYSAHELQNWAGSKRIVIYENDQQVRDFVRDALTSTDNSNRKMYYGKIPDDIADRVHAETGISIKGHNCAISEAEIRKIIKDHGNETKEQLRGQRAVTIEDFVNIPKVILNSDKILLAPNAYNGRPVIHFSKTINGKTTVVVYVSVRSNDMAIHTMYSGRNKRGVLATPTADQAAINTPEANGGTDSPHTYI